MSSKKVFLNLIAIIGFACVFVVPFVDIFQYVAGFGEESSVVAAIGMFGDFSNYEAAINLLNGNFSTVWPLLNSIFIIVTMVLALAYIVIALTGVVNSKLGKKLAKIQKLIAILALVSAILMVAFGVIVTILSHVELLSSWAELAGAIGLFLQFGAILGAAFAMWASYSKK